MSTEVISNTIASDGIEVVEYKLVSRSRRYTTWQGWKARPRVYVWIKDESVLENFASRFERTPREYRPFVKAVLAEIGVEYERFTWSQRAGCTCGCSPGFVIYGSEYLVDEEGQRSDLHITIDGENVRKLITESGMFRLAQLIGTKRAKEMADQIEAEVLAS